MKNFKKTARTLQKPDACSEYSAFEIWRALYCMKEKISRPLTAEDKKSNFCFYDEISKIQSAISRIELTWSITQEEEKIAVGYMSELQATDFSIYEIADAAYFFILAYIMSHQLPRKVVRQLRWKAAYLDYKTFEEDGKTLSVDDMTVEISFCTLDFFPKLTIAEEIL